MRRLEWWRNHPPLLFSCLLHHHRRHTSCLHDIPCGRTPLNDQFGVEAAERVGSDADDDAPPHLTGDYCQSSETKPKYSYLGNTHHNTDHSGNIAAALGDLPAAVEIPVPNIVSYSHSSYDIIGPIC